MLNVFNQTALATNPNVDDIRVPIAISQAAAFTILSTESLLVYQNHSPATGLAARQEEGLRTLLRLIVTMETVVTSREVSSLLSVSCQLLNRFYYWPGSEKLRPSPAAYCAASDFDCVTTERGRVWSAVGPVDVLAFPDRSDIRTR